MRNSMHEWVNGWWLAAIAGALLIAAPAAAQQSCLDDSDCDEGLMCSGDRGSSSSGSVADSDSGSAPAGEATGEVAGVAVAGAAGGGDGSAGSQDAVALMTKLAYEEVGRCVVAPTRCQSDDDCEDHYECSFDDTDPATSCLGCETSANEDGTDEDAGVAVDEPAAEGYCDPQPIECEQDADCADSLVCEGGECAIELIQCEADDECASGEECAAWEGGTDCNGTGSAPIIADDGTVIQEATFEEECTTSEEHLCFPLRQVCDSDDDCDSGASCFDFTTFEGGAPPFWGDTERACLPEAWLLVLDGHVGPTEATLEALGGSDSGGGESSQTTSDSGSGALTGDTSDAVGDADDAASSDAKGESAETASSGGCGVSLLAARSRSIPGVALALLLGVGLVRRSRKSARR